MHGGADREANGEREDEDVGGRKSGAKNRGTVDASRAGGCPAIGAATASGSLLLGEEDRAFGRAGGGGVHGSGVGRVDFVIVLDVFGEDRVFYERRDDVREKEIGDGAELITGGGVSGDVNAELAELLDEAPDFRASRADFVGDLGAAHDDGGIVGEQADDASETSVGLLGHGGFRSAKTRDGICLVL